MVSGGGDEATGYPLWSFREDVYIESAGNGTLVVHSRWEDVAIPGPTFSVLDALRRMSLGPISLTNVITARSEQHELDRILDRLEHLVVRSFGFDPEQPLISVVPLTQQARLWQPSISPDLPVRLSRFAMMQTDGRDYYIESPLSLHRVLLHQADAVSMIGWLSRPVVPASMGMAGFISVISYLMAAGMVVQARGGDPLQAAGFTEDTDPVLATWTPLDLMFHTRSTLGRHDFDFGATYPLGEQGGIEPVVKPSSDRAPIALRRPQWDELLAADPQLTLAVEATRHARHCGEAPLQADNLGDLLYRTARVRSLIGSPSGTATGSTSDRPYPSIGECYELELYITVDHCPGIPRGVYHYDPLGHQLEPVDFNSDGVSEVLENARMAANLAVTPPTLITITARFRRLSWKYNGLSYALVLKNVGILTQTLSLVGTSMGLAVCWLDSGDIDTSTRLFRTDWRIESSVGGLVIGNRADVAPDEDSRWYGVNDAEWADRALHQLS